MRTIQTAEPRRELREFVRSFAYREIVCEDGGFSQPNISTLEQVWRLSWAIRWFSTIRTVRARFVRELSAGDR